LRGNGKIILSKCPARLKKQGGADSRKSPEGGTNKKNGHQHPKESGESSNEKVGMPLRVKEKYREKQSQYQGATSAGGRTMGIAEWETRKK